MSTSSVDCLEDKWVRTWFGRQRRVIILAVAGLLAVSACTPRCGCLPNWLPGSAGSWQVLAPVQGAHALPHAVG